MRLVALPNGSWRILGAKYGAKDEGFLVPASGIHSFNAVGGDLGRVYVVAAEMSCGDVEPSFLATVVRWHHLINPWGRNTVRGGTR